MPGEGLFCSQMSFVFFCHMLIDPYISIGFESAANCAQVNCLVVAVSWYGQDSIVVGHQISRRDPAASCHFHVNSGMFQHDNTAR